MVSRLVLLGAGARPPVSMFVVPGANRRLGLGDVMASGPRRAWGTWRELRRDDLSARMERVTSPTLVARGSHDERWCAAEARSLVRRCTDGTYVEVAGTGPAAPVVHPDAVADTVTAFLRQH
jgi:pimeloyl-ACP methyl ester carboxylesterase